jgi:hypothetical protein
MLGVDLHDLEPLCAMSMEEQDDSNNDLYLKGSGSGEYGGENI